MKPIHLLPALFLFAAACHSSSGDGAAAGPWTPPGPGTVVAADSMRYTEDPLNQFYFAVKLTVSSDNAGAKGDYGFVYDLSTHCGPGELTGKINMPAGGKALKPLLRKDPKGGYKYIIGFVIPENMGGDGKTFQDYYSIAGSRDRVEIQPLKSYRFR